MFLISIDVFPAAISPMIVSNFLTSFLGSLKNITLPPFFFSDSRTFYRFDYGFVMVDILTQYSKALFILL